MGRIVTTVELPVSVQDCWPLMADFNRISDWLTIHVKFKDEVPPIEDITVGAQVSEVVTMLGMPNTITWTVEEWEPLKRVKLTGTAMAGVKAEMVTQVEDRGGKTGISLEAEYTGNMLAGALGKAVEKEAYKQLEASLANVRKILTESESANA